MRAVFSNLEDAYETGYADGMADMRKRYRSRQEKKPAAGITSNRNYAA